MTRGRASLAAVVAAALLAMALPGAGAAAAAPAASATAKTSVAVSSSVAKKRTAAKKRAAAKRRAAKRRARMRWRSSTVGFQVGAGLLFGSTAPGGAPGAPGSPAPSGGSPPGGSPTTPAPEYHAVSVAAREYSLTLSRQLLTPGLQTVQLNNRGEDPHDLVISPEGTHDPLVDFPETPSEENHTEKVPLAAGRYLLWCSLPGHEALGMRATLRVE